MNTTTRFLTGGLASLAVASAVTLAGPSAYAADDPGRPCGQPAVPAVYLTVVHEPGVRRVPAVTHEEWRWQHDVTTVEHEYSREVAAAYSETVDTTREVGGVTEFLWSHKVVTQAAAPAVPGTSEQGHDETVTVTPAVTETEFEYVQQTTGHLQWHADGWNAQTAEEDKGKGWTKTGRTRDVVVQEAVTSHTWVVDRAKTAGTPAVEEVSHLEETWSAAGDDGWTKVRHTHVVPAQVVTVWAEVAPEGYSPTGRSWSTTKTVQTDVLSATAPQGEGWTTVPGSAATVVDQPEGTVIDGNGSTEEVLVRPELAGSPDCPGGSGTDVPTLSTVAGPKLDGPTAVSAAHAPTTFVEAATGPSTVLPDTGNPVSAVLLGAGLGAVVAGGVLVRAGRRRRTS